jgi:hypothetical protein
LPISFIGASNTGFRIPYGLKIAAMALEANHLHGNPCGIIRR